MENIKIRRLGWAGHIERMEEEEEEEEEEEITKEGFKRKLGVPDGTVNCTVYTMSQTPRRTLKSED